MMISLLFAFLGLQQPGPTAQQIQQQIQITDRTLQQVDALGRQVGDVRQSVEQMRTTVLNNLKTVCSSDVTWQSSASAKIVDAQSVVAASVLSLVSAPADDCLNADIRINASYFAENGAFVCSGGVSVAQSANVQTVLFEFRPLNLEYFAKWRDGPTWERSNFHRLVCVDYEGIANLDPGAFSRTLKLTAIVLPKRGGIAKAEMSVALPQPNPNPPPPGRRVF
jgi:hypothetical protein